MNADSVMQPNAAELMRNMSIEAQAQAVEMALQRVDRNVVLVQDRDTSVCWRNGQLKMHRSGAGRSWTCRKITARLLVKIAPARRVMEVLGEAL